MSSDMPTSYQEIVISDRKQQILLAAIEMIANEGGVFGRGSPDSPQ